jgi:uncharacterized membrane protein YgaE (UPF0421/DUF939 family)
VELSDRIKFALQETLKPHDGEEGNIKLAPTKEASRVNFYIWRLVNLPSKLSQIDHKIFELNARIHSDSSWKYWPTMAFFFAKPIKDLYNSVKHLGRSIFVSKSKEREQLNRTAPQFLHNKISMAYVIRLPILLGLVSVVMILVNRQLTEYPRYIRGVWAVFTVAVVLMPSVGSTWQRSFERILGSLIGAIFAEITVYAASVVDSDGLAIAFTFGFLFYFLGTYLQHSTAYDRPYSLIVANLTYQTVVYAQYPFNTADIYFAIARSLVVIFGIIIAFLGSLIFPSLSLNFLRDSLQKSLKEACSIIVQGMQVHEYQQKEEELSRRIDQLNFNTVNQSRLLKEARQELISPIRRKNLGRTVQAMQNVAFMLLALRDLFCEKIELIDEFYMPLNRYLEKIQKIMEHQVELFSRFLTTQNKFVGRNRRNIQEVKEIMLKMFRKHKMTRKDLVAKKLIYSFHPQLLQFHSYLFVLRDLLISWEMLIALSYETNTTSLLNYSPFIK